MWNTHSGTENFIHPTAVIDPSAKLGEGNFIGPFCVLGPNVILGSYNRLAAHVCLGTPPQHRTEFEWGGVIIGDRNTFHEFSQVHQATQKDHPTRVGSHGYFMKGAHVAHDCLIEDWVTMCNDVALGGHTTIMKYATLGLLTVVHQYQVIGSFAMIGMGTVVPKRADIEPGGIFAGNPAVFKGENKIGLDRNRVTAEMLAAERARYREFRAAAH